MKGMRRQVSRKVEVEFPRIITLLRKEAGFTQKKVAKDLGISQALLSHYEKGIRECGLSFLVKCSKYYNVSTDYLLGVSPVKDGVELTINNISNPDELGRENVFKGSMLPVLNKKIIANSLNIIYDYLAKADNKELITNSSLYIMTALYQVFRYLHQGHEDNQDILFQIPASIQKSYSRALMAQLEGKMDVATLGEKVYGIPQVENKYALEINMESLSDNYAMFASSILNLIKNVENEIENMAKN